jgi:sodium-dependent phosphate cotransporter
MSAPATKKPASDTTEVTQQGWDVDFSSDVKTWGELTGGEKVQAVLVVLAKLSVIVGSLYLFICSLSFLASGFRLVAGRQAGELFRNSEVFNNPIAGMLVGVLVTVLVQSSSTSTSIVITMVAADLFTVPQAISLVMGANIGTSVTSTIVALMQSTDRDEFRRAFAAATVHDMFNFCSVMVLLPLEAMTGYLYHLSGALLPAGLESDPEMKQDILKKLTKPFTKAILSIDKKVITKIAAAETQEELDALEGKHMLKHIFGNGPDSISDGAAGVIALIGALTTLCVTLFLIIYTLRSLLKGRIAVWLHKSVNGHVPDIKCGGTTIPMGWASGYLAMLTGVGVTILVQSSSITTSALTPLVGVGVISIERMFPTVLGANIGTCVTGLLAALAADGSKLYLTLRVAFSHLLFNLTGIVIWYVIWPMRIVPVSAAKFLGNTTAEYRWFALAYLAMCFFFIPLLFMGLSLASTAACVVVAVICILVAVFVTIVNVLQTKKPTMLPEVLRTWAFLPEFMRSLKPFDRVVCGPLDKLCCAWWAKRVQKGLPTTNAVQA